MYKMLSRFLTAVVAAWVFLPLGAEDIGGKLGVSLWGASAGDVKSVFPNCVQGDEAGSFFRFPAEEMPQLGDFSAVDGMIFIEEGKISSIHLFGYRRIRSEKPLTDQEISDLRATARKAFAVYFPVPVGTEAKDTSDDGQISGRLFRGDGGDLLWCEVRDNAGCVACVAGIFPPKGAPKNLREYASGVLDTRYLSVFDPETGGRIYMIPDGEAGVPKQTLTSTAVRLGRFYGVNASQKTAQDCVGTEGADGGSTIRHFRSIRKMENKCGLSIREVMDGDNIMTKKKRDLVERNYNRAVSAANRKIRDRAKRKKDMDLDDDDDELSKFPNIDPEIFVKSRTFDKIGENRFEREVRTSLERGNPLLWCVMEFKKDKAGKPVAGVPVFAWKILCGYGAKERKVFFIDCYTNASPTELSLDEAWAITLKLYQVSRRK